MQVPDNLMRGKWRRLAAALLTTVAVHAVFVVALDRVAVNSVAGLAGISKSFDVTLTGVTPPTGQRNRITTLKNEQVSPSIVPASIPGTPALQTHPTSKTADDLRRTQYFLRNRLQSGPVPVSDIEPVYPERAGSIQGKVVLTVFINEQGIVDEVVIVRAFPEGLFEAAAIDAFSKAVFSPGTKLGVAVKSQMTIEVAFSAFTKM